MRIGIIMSTFVCLLCLPGFAVFQDQQGGIDVALAARYFHEASDLCKTQAANLWNVQLYGPILLVDPHSREIIANQADGEGRLRKQGEVFIGTLPPEVNIANTAMTWAGTKWTMAMWPLPEERRARLGLMTHELFHRIQDQIGLSAKAEGTNLHLNSQDGRTWLRIEWRALQRALQENGILRRKAIADAICFRRYRQALFPGSAMEEAALESHEGIAEYTGLKASSRTVREFIARAWSRLQQSGDSQSFVRSFAYSSGPAYGALLDIGSIRWRDKFRSGNDLSDILAHALRINPNNLSEKEVLVRAKLYDGDEIIEAEAQREVNRRAEISLYRARFIDGPVLILPDAGSFKYSFNPNSLVPLSENAVVYPTMRATDKWGILEVSEGVLLLSGKMIMLHVVAPNDSQARPLRGRGWILDLNTGWEVAPGERQGDLILRKQPEQRVIE
jgi:hypothetical protein